MNIAKNIYGAPSAAPFREEMWDGVTKKTEVESYKDEIEDSLVSEALGYSSSCKCVLGAVLAFPISPLFIPPAMALECVQTVRSSPYCYFNRRSVCMSCYSIGIEALSATVLSMIEGCKMLVVVPGIAGRWCSERRVRLLFREKFCDLVCSDLSNFPHETLERELPLFVSRYAREQAERIVDRIDFLRKKVLKEAFESFPKELIGVISSYLLPISLSMADGATEVNPLLS